MRFTSLYKQRSRHLALYKTREASQRALKPCVASLFTVVDLSASLIFLLCWSVSNASCYRLTTSSLVRSLRMPVKLRLMLSESVHTVGTVISRSPRVSPVCSNSSNLRFKDCRFFQTMENVESERGCSFVFENCSGKGERFLYSFLNFLRNRYSLCTSSIS